MTTREEIQERATAAFEELVAALEQGNSEQLTAYLQTMSRFHQYSFGNCMWIVLQRPDATHVAGFHRWKQFGRFVKSGEKGIAILAPLAFRKKRTGDEEGGEDQPPTDEDNPEKSKRRVAGFKVAYVFDVSQTDGKPLPEFAAVDGDPGDKLERLEGVIRGFGIELNYEPISGGALGVTPESFSLNVSPPIVTVQAAFSKHRRKDVLPLHADLVALLRTWLSGLGPKDKLFPKLAGRKTWLMVQKDLEAAGIAYVTSEGVADFHASGRHTHITELFRNGATVPEAKALARHSDVKMTMKYTHIGIADQARAVSRLPVPKKSPDGPVESVKRRGRALHGRCISGVSDCPEPSSPVTGLKFGQKENPAGGGVYVSSCHNVAGADKVEAAGIEPAS